MFLRPESDSLRCFTTSSGFPSCSDWNPSSSPWLQTCYWANLCAPQTCWPLSAPPVLWGPFCPWISTPKLCPKVGVYLSARLCPCHSSQPGISPSEASSKYPSSFLFSSCYSDSASPLLLSVFLFLRWLVYCLCLLMRSVQALWGQGHCPSCTLDSAWAAAGEWVNSHSSLSASATRPWHSCLNPLAPQFLPCLISHGSSSRPCSQTLAQPGFPSILVFTLLTDFFLVFILSHSLPPTCCKSHPVWAITAEDIKLRLEIHLVLPMVFCCF